MDLLQIANRMKGIEASPTIRLNALAQELSKQGKDIVNLTAGETDFASPLVARSAAIDSINSDFSKYTGAHGIPELRAAICEWFKRAWNLEYKAENVTVTCGAKQGLFNFFFAVLNAGDEVLIPQPYWVSYPEMVRMMGGIPKFLPSEPENGFNVNPKDVLSAITPKTRVLVLNTPNNPTGAYWGEDALREIAKGLEGTNILVVSDEIYGGLLFGGMKYLPFAKISSDAFSRTITFNGLSKSHAMTGWRIGFAAGPKSIIDSMGIIQGQSATHIPSILQKAVIAALSVDTGDMSAKSRDLEARCKLALDLLNIEGIKLKAPTGAFYLFPDVSFFYGKKTPSGKQVNGSDSIAEYLLEEVGVAVVPGRPFGEDRCIRISFSKDMETIRKGCQRIVAALQKLTG